MAIPVSGNSEFEVVERKITKKPSQKDVLDGGRVMGAIARSDPEVFEAIKEYAEGEGVSTVQATTMILKKYLMAQKVEASGITVPQLLTAWDILKEMMKMNMWIFTSFGSMFFNEMTMAISQIVDNKVKERLDGLETAVSKANTSSNNNSDVNSKIKDKMFTLIEPLIDGLMTNVMKSTGMNVPETLKVKIPVTTNINVGVGNNEGVAKESSGDNTKENIQEAKS